MNLPSRENHFVPAARTPSRADVHMDPPAGAGSAMHSGGDTSTSGAAPGGALAGATREQLVKAVERSARKLKSADERATNAEASAERALVDAERVKKEAAEEVDQERKLRVEAEGKHAELEERICLVEAKLASTERSLSQSNEEKEKAQAEAETARDALSKASSSASATQSASNESAIELGTIRSLLETKEAELSTLKAEMRKVTTKRESETKKVVAALADIKKKMQKLEAKRDALEVTLKEEGVRFVEMESKFETKLYALQSHLSEEESKTATAINSENEYKQRAGVLLQEKDREIETLKKSGSSLDPKYSIDGGGADLKSGDTATQDATIAKLKREVHSLTNALRDAEQRSDELQHELSSVAFDANQREESLRNLVNSANVNASRAKSERDAGNIAASELRNLVTELEAKAFKQEASVINAARESDLVAKNALANSEKYKLKYETLASELKNAREASEKMLTGKDRELKELGYKVGQVTMELEQLRARVQSGDTARSSKNTPYVRPVSSYDDDDDMGLEAFTAYVLGETGGGVDDGVKKYEPKRDDPGGGPRPNAAAPQPSNSATGDSWDFGITSSFNSVYDYFGGTDSTAVGQELRESEQALGANASAGANALLAARKTGESKA